MKKIANIINTTPTMPFYSHFHPYEYSQRKDFFISKDNFPMRHNEKGRRVEHGRYFLGKK